MLSIAMTPRPPKTDNGTGTGTKQRDTGDEQEVECNRELCEYPVQRVDDKTFVSNSHVIRGFEWDIGEVIGGESDMGARGPTYTKHEIEKRLKKGEVLPSTFLPNSSFNPELLYQNPTFISNKQSKYVENLGIKDVSNDIRHLVCGALVWGETYLKNLVVVFADYDKLPGGEQRKTKKAMKQLKKVLKLHRVYTMSEYQKEFTDRANFGPNSMPIRHWDAQTASGDTWREMKKGELQTNHNVGELHLLKKNNLRGEEQLMNVLVFTQAYAEYLDEVSRYLIRERKKEPEISKADGKQNPTNLVQGDRNYLPLLYDQLSWTLLFTPTVYLYVSKHPLDKLSKRRLSQINSIGITHDEFYEQVAYDKERPELGGRLYLDKPRFGIPLFFGCPVEGLGRAQNVLECAITGKGELDPSNREVLRLVNGYLLKSELLPKSVKAYLWIQKHFS